MKRHTFTNTSIANYLESMPTFMHGQIEISLAYDPIKSSTFLLMQISQRDANTLRVIDTEEHVCRALDISTDSWHRNFYVREMCKMLSECITANEPSLITLKTPIQIMTSSWDILGVFLWTEEFKNTQTVLTPAPTYKANSVLTLNEIKLLDNILLKHEIESRNLLAKNSENILCGNDLALVEAENISSLRTKISKMLEQGDI